MTSPKIAMGRANSHWFMRKTHKTVADTASKTMADGIMLKFCVGGHFFTFVNFDLRTRQLIGQEDSVTKRREHRGVGMGQCVDTFFK